MATFTMKDLSDLFGPTDGSTPDLSGILGDDPTSGIDWSSIGSDPTAGGIDWGSLTGGDGGNGVNAPDPSNTGGIDLSPIPTIPPPQQLIQTPNMVPQTSTDWSSLLGTGGGIASTILHSLLGTNGSGAINLASLIPMLGAGALGAYQSSNTQNATQQTLNAINSANKQITGLVGTQQAAYNPYTQAGTSALGKLQGMIGTNNLAGNFKPLGKGSGIG